MMHYVRWLITVVFSLELVVTLSVRAASVPARSNQTVPPFDFQMALPLVVTSPMPINVTHHPATDFGPAWSPDGSKLAFVSDRTGKPEVYVMRVDGSNVTQLTDELFVPGPAENLPWCTIDVTWLPHGKEIAFSLETCPPSQPGTHDPYGVAIYVIDAEGGSARLISPYGHTPVWSPDGQMFAYSAPESAYWEPFIYWLRIADSDGSATPVNVKQGYAPDWAPDSTRIAFVQRGDVAVQLATIKVDGSGYTIVSTAFERFVDSPLWSPNGNQIAYRFQQIRSYQLRVVNLETGTRTTLSQIEWHRIVSPAWAPHRNQLLFWGEDFYATLPAGFYLYDLDAEALRLLLRLGLPEEVESIVWSPDRTKVVFVQDGDIYVLRVPHE